WSREHGREVLDVGLGHGAEHEYARRVDRATKAAPGCGDPLERRLPVVLAGDVEDVLDVLAVLQIAADPQAARIHDRPTDGRADGARGAGDEDGTIGQARHGGSLRARMAACSDGPSGPRSPTSSRRSASA